LHFSRKSVFLSALRETFGELAATTITNSGLNLRFSDFTPNLTLRRI
jgi:hypothetical protein